MYFYQVIDTRTFYALQSTELPQQFATFFRAQARNLLKPRCRACFGTPLPMSRNGESVRLVANLLDQQQRR